MDKFKAEDFVKYGKIRGVCIDDDLSPFLARDLEVYEKIDGGNCHVRWAQNQTTGQYELAGCNKANFLTGPILSRERWFVEFTKWMRKTGALYALPKQDLIFGEWTGNPGSIDYKGYNHRFFVLDFFDTTTGKVHDYETTRVILQSMGLDNDVVFLRPLTRGKITRKVIERLLIEECSGYYRGPKEGLVLRPLLERGEFTTTSNYVKILHPDYEEKRRMANGEYNFVTPRRVKKVIQRIREDSGDSKLSEDFVVDAVIKDMIEEGGNVNWDKQFEGRVASLVRKELDSWSA